MPRIIPLTVIVLVALCPLAALAGDVLPVPPESVYDTSVGPDEALVNLRIQNHRWPDCHTLETTTADIFRIEGVDDTPDASEAKAVALWRWLLTLMSTSGGRVFEGNPHGKWVRCHGDKDTQQIEIRRGDKLLPVYGLHECGGVSRVMVHLWRAADFLAYQEASSGHSVACLRFPDADGVWRMHSFNPQGRSYYWDPVHDRIGARRRPVMNGVEYKAFLPPMEHSLRTSLRVGETLTRRWSNDGYLQMTQRMGYWKKRPADRQWDAFCVGGQEDQELVASTDAKTYAGQLYTGSSNTACSDGKLHPAKAGEPARFVWRLASPYVAIEAEIAATLRSGPGDTCRLQFSNDGGKTWHTFFEKQKPGAETVKLSLGRERYWADKPTITSHYSFLIRAELQAAKDAGSVGVDALQVTVHRQLNMRALPNLAPGENVWKVSADRVPEGMGLSLQVHYEVNGQAQVLTRWIGKFPYYFRIDVNSLPADKLANEHYLANWGGEKTFNLPEHPLRMTRIVATLAPHPKGLTAPSMPAEQAEPYFRKSYPIPNKWDRKMANRSKVPKYESEVSGFFPQLPREDGQPTDPREYYNWLVDHIGNGGTPLGKVDAGVDPVEMMIAKLPKAHGIYTLFIANALAHMKDKRAIPALLAKWDQAPRYGPGDRYIPDALAAMGDRSVVPKLAAKLTRLRFDYRIHIAHALGILGGAEAEKTLKLLAEKDPNISVRGEARRALQRLQKSTE